MAGGGARTDALTEETSEQCYRSNTRLSCRRVELSDFPSANTSTIKEGVYDARFRCDNMLASYQGAVVATFSRLIAMVIGENRPKRPRCGSGQNLRKSK